MHSASPFIQGTAQPTILTCFLAGSFLLFIWISGDCFLRPKHVHISYTSVHYSIPYGIIIIYVFDILYYFELSFLCQHWEANADDQQAHTRPKLGLRMPEFSPSGAEHSSAGYRYGVCFMQTPTLPQHNRSHHRSPRRLHCPQHGRVPRTSGVFCTLHQIICVVMSKHVTNNLVLCRKNMLY